MDELIEVEELKRHHSMVAIKEIPLNVYNQRSLFYHYKTPKPNLLETWVFF